jgi:hypothetical protein
MIMGIIAGILVIILLLVLIGLGWDTIYSRVKKGADKVGITPIVERVSNGAIEIFKNATRDIIGSSFLVTTHKEPPSPAILFTVCMKVTKLIMILIR